MDSWTKIQSGSIYYALNKLEKEGLILLSEKLGIGTKVRKVYSITEKGKNELKELVKQELNCKICEVGSNKFIIYPLLNTIDKNVMVTELKDHIQKLNDQKTYLEEWQKIKVNEKTLAVERISFEMMLSNLEYQIKWHDALINAPLKRVFDRLSYLFHRQELIRKPVLTLVTTDGGGHKQVSKYLKMTVCGWGCNLVGAVNIISPMFFENKDKNSAWGYDEYYHNKNIQKIEKFVKSFVEIIVDNKTPIPTFYDIFMFNCLRSKTFTSQADYDFWKKKGWINSNYFYDVKINLIKKGFGSLLKNIINSAGKKLRNKYIQYR